MPTSYRSPVLSIDLGASYTKLAWRPAWAAGTSQFTEASKVLKIGGQVLVPSIVLETGDGQCYFGREAAGMTPKAGDRLHKNWKSVLFDDKPAPDALKNALLVAEKFFRWLRVELKACGHVLESAHTRVCVPEFANSRMGCDRILSAMESAGWNAGETISRETEPKANLVGLASRGQNHANVVGSTPTANLRGVYENSFGLVNMARNAEHNLQRRFCTIDIGAFTTDISIADVAADIKIVEQKSFEHGIARLDRQVEALILTKGGRPEEVPYDEFETLKRYVYAGQPYKLAGNHWRVELEKGCMDKALIAFADAVAGFANEYEGLHNLILSGGGSFIPTIAQTIKSRFSNLYQIQPRFSEKDHERAATALGGASVIIDFYKPAEPFRRFGPAQGESNCSCGGANVHCMRCWGTGIWKRSGVGGDHEDKRPTTSGKTDDGIAAQVRPADLAKANPSPHSPGIPEGRPGASPIVGVVRRERGGVNSQRAPFLVTWEQIEECWKEKEGDALSRFCLEGWMGRLVFDETDEASQRRHILIRPSTAEGKAAWCKLLCLCTSLGVRTHPSAVRVFWERELPEVWGALIPKDGNASSSAVMDRFFEDKIHRQFGDHNASGEDAELWRRVFYDFRKLHHFVYQNELPEALLELLRQPGLPCDALVHFLKSGLVPGQNHNRWRGVLGQSMSAPLLLLMRMLRRLGIIDRQDVDAACFYMNGPARRVAARLGWIDERMWYGIDTLLELSRKCHANMSEAAPQLGGFFDIPLQWYAHQHRSELGLT